MEWISWADTSAWVEYDRATGIIDCLIAAVAWRRGATLLAQDVDLHRLAS